MMLIQIVLICIFNKKTNKMLDFGTQWKEFNAGKRNFTLSPEISVKAKNNRLLLKKIMEKVGFYQFPGEWWHFSFGDREWAAAHNKTKSLYQQIELTMSL